jgi:hypothetical protein
MLGTASDVPDSCSALLGKSSARATAIMRSWTHPEPDVSTTSQKTNGICWLDTVRKPATRQPSAFGWLRGVDLNIPEQALTPELCQPRPMTEALADRGARSESLLLYYLLWRFVPAETSETAPIYRNWSTEPELQAFPVSFGRGHSD